MGGSLRRSILDGLKAFASDLLEKRDAWSVPGVVSTRALKSTNAFGRGSIPSITRGDFDIAA